MKLAEITIADTNPHYTETVMLRRDKDVVFSYVHTGTLTATIFLQVGVMIRENLGTAASVQWKTTTATFDTLPAGSASSDSETFHVGAYNCVRLKIVAASGSGTIAPSMNIKD